LQRRLSPGARQPAATLAAGCGCADAQVAPLCANLLALDPALWRFAVTEGGGAEEQPRGATAAPGGLWWKSAFGRASADGCSLTD
jgi:hypothetical protein